MTEDLVNDLLEVAAFFADVVVLMYTFLKLAGEYDVPRGGRL